MPKLFLVKPKSGLNTSERILQLLQAYPQGITIKELSDRLNRPVSMLQICLKSLVSAQKVQAKLSNNGMQLIYYPKRKIIKKNFPTQNKLSNTFEIEQKPMIIAVASLKGGVGKTTTAIHLATYFQEKEPTLLVDADRNRSALVWAKEEKLPFYVASQAGAAGLIRKYNHIITDMKARPELDDLRDLAEGSDLVIIPTTPNHLDLDATIKAVEILSPLDVNYKILLTKVDARTKNGILARNFLEAQKLPLFKADIPLLVAFERASQHGLTVRDFHDFRSRQAWRQYQSIGDEIVSCCKS